MIVFQSTLFRTQRERANAVAYEWLTAGSANNADDVTRFLREATDEQLAAEVIKEWGLPTEGATNDEGEPLSDDEIYDPDDLVRAFANFRAERPDVAAKED